jgi:hypothetical protein
MKNGKRPDMDMAPQDGDMFIPKHYIKTYSHGECHGVILSLRPMQGGKEVPATLYRRSTQEMLSKKR